MNQPSKETMKLLLTLIRPTTEKIIREQKEIQQKEKEKDDSK